MVQPCMGRMDWQNNAGANADGIERREGEEHGKAAPGGHEQQKSDEAGTKGRGEGGGGWYKSVVSSKQSNWP